MATTEAQAAEKNDQDFRLGRWRVLPSLVQLRADGETVRLEPKVMDLLAYLARHPREVLSKNEILDAVWPDTVIADDALHRYVSKLRHCLGDDPRRPEYVETIPKRGYRLIAPVSFGGVEGGGTGGVESTSRRRSADRSLLRQFLPWGIAVLATGIALAGHFRRDVDLSAAGALNSRPAVAPAADPQAYELYLQSLAYARDGGSNQRAIRMLEQVVALEPDFAPAWDALAERLYYDGAYQLGGEPALARARAASQRAAELDPELLSAPMVQALMQVEGGRLEEGYDAARRLLEKYPHRAEGHFALSYVYRYAGLLEEAARECDVALSISPGNYRFRSCAVAFIRLGRFDRAMDFIRLDPTSELGIYHQGYLLFQQGRVDGAERAWRRLADDSWAFGLLEACRERPDSPKTRAHVQRIQPAVMQDPEAWYFVALVMNACGEAATALDLLTAAVEKGYCAVSAFETERFLLNLSTLESWAEARAQAAECRSAFLAHQAEHPAVRWPRFR